MNVNLKTMEIFLNLLYYYKIYKKFRSSSNLAIEPQNALVRNSRNLIKSSKIRNLEKTLNFIGVLKFQNRIFIL